MTITDAIAQAKDQITIERWGDKRWKVCDYDPSRHIIRESDPMDWWHAQEHCRHLRTERAVRLMGAPKAAVRCAERQDLVGSVRERVASCLRIGGAA